MTNVTATAQLLHSQTYHHIISESVTQSDLLCCLWQMYEAQSKTHFPREYMVQFNK